MSLAPEPFNLNQSNAVCLPLVSDCKRLVWVHSDQVELPADGVAELEKAFDRFPYLTQKQRDALAQRCSLHPDQVKTWFMVQRLRYGISWEYKDICKVRRKFKSGERNKDQLKARGDSDEQKQGGKEAGGKKAGRVMGENSARMMGGKVSIDERLERNAKREEPMKEEESIKVEEAGGDERNPQKRRKRMVETDPTGKRKKVDESVAVRPGGVTKVKAESGTKKVFLSVREWPDHKRFVVVDEALDARPPYVPIPQTHASDAPPVTYSQIQSTCGTPVHGKTKMEDVLEGDRRGETANPGCPPVRKSTKTYSQLVMMRQAFAQCQYPDTEAYSQLAALIGVPRGTLVQWFGDMRYYIKERKPLWLSEEQYSQALATVRYRQCLKLLGRVVTSKSDSCVKVGGV